MANTDVVLRDEMGLRIPSISQVTISVADTVTFSVEQGADSALYFSPKTAAILSPNPGARVDLTFGQKLTYTFVSVGNDAWGVITQAPQSAAPESFDFGSPSNPPVLTVQPGQGVDFPVPTNPTQT
jgi:hypothetical protein